MSNLLSSPSLSHAASHVFASILRFAFALTQLQKWASPKCEEMEVEKVFHEQKCDKVQKTREETQCKQVSAGLR